MSKKARYQPTTDDVVEAMHGIHPQPLGNILHLIAQHTHRVSSAQQAMSVISRPALEKLIESMVSDGRLIRKSGPEWPFEYWQPSQGSAIYYMLARHIEERDARAEAQHQQDEDEHQERVRALRRQTAQQLPKLLDDLDGLQSQVDSLTSARPLHESP
ncbi:hypothetical protein ACIOEX_26120 [Streptomyces sp. NPDC087850]|uniref:hypothetical protein n=1 Tax=Streptomyces sp. NPDC087850 TaxID=3365809 RepID=UPI00380B81B4